jgi:hypothetical protein
MTPNPKKLVRFFSEQHHQNNDYINEENNISEYSQLLIKTNRNFFRQFSPQTEQKIDRFISGVQRLSNLLEKPIFTGVSSIQEDQLFIKNVDVIIPSSLSHTIIETGLNYHRDIKGGSQRFRWHLVFNILLWLIIPLPFWIPFLSNKVAYYLLPSIQGVFVAIWISN